MTDKKRVIHSVSFLALIVFCSSTLSAGSQLLDGANDPQPNRASLAVVGGMLIDGHGGPPVDHAVVLIDGNKIVAAGPGDQFEIPD